MTLTLRQRIVLTLLPVLVLIAVVGGSGVILLHRIGSSIDAILRENYASVIAMERLNEAVERIDSSFQFALARRPDLARAQYDESWKRFESALLEESANVTIHPREDELVARLNELSGTYRHAGDAFHARPVAETEHGAAYFGPGGLLESFNAIKEVANQILRLNQENMEHASRVAQESARSSLTWFAIGLGGATLLLAFLGWRMVHDVLQPIVAVTQSALAIGKGNLDQVVPVTSNDELGQLADAFNQMGRQLRHYRQTDYARLLRAQRTSQASIDAFPDPVLVVDAEGCVEMANPAAQRVLGVSPRRGEQPALPWQPPDALRPALTEALQHQQASIPVGFENVITLRADDTDLSFLPRVLPIRDPYGNSLGAAVSLLDVTRFQLLDQVKSNLVGTVSHELKTPLTSIRLALHLLLEEVVGPLLPKQLELLVDARENAERLLDRVNHLLDLARLEQQPGSIDLRPEPVEALVQSAADAVRPRAESKALKLLVDVAPDLPAVAVDAIRLSHALGNLLDNAVTYTERGGRITVAAALSGDNVTVSVTDTGIGIPSEHVPHVFDKFFRVPGQSEGGGTGLGLALVHEIALAHGGDVSCSSTPGVGTTFHVTLPVWKTGDDAQPRSQS